MPQLLTHPEWCDPAECDAVGPFAQHRGRARRIGGPRPGDVHIAARLTCTSDDPLPEAPVSVELVLTRTEHPADAAYLLDRSTAHHLHAALGELLPAMTA